jgi:hypothetical protein
VAQGPARGSYPFEGNFTLEFHSPCLDRLDPECGFDDVGAHGLGCIIEVSVAETMTPTTWGRLKVRYR